MAQRCFKQSCCGSEALQRSAPAPSCVTLPAWRQLNSKLTDASNTKYVQLMLPSPESFRVSSISNFGKDLTRSPAQGGPDKNCGIWPLFFAASGWSTDCSRRHCQGRTPVYSDAAFTLSMAPDLSHGIAAMHRTVDARRERSIPCHCIVRSCIYLSSHAQIYGHHPETRFDEKYQEALNARVYCAH